MGYNYIPEWNRPGEVVTPETHSPGVYSNTNTPNENPTSLIGTIGILGPALIAIAIVVAAKIKK